MKAGKQRKSQGTRVFLSVWHCSDDLELGKCLRLNPRWTESPGYLIPVVFPTRGNQPSSGCGCFSLSARLQACSLLSGFPCSELPTAVQGGLLEKSFSGACCPHGRIIMMLFSFQNSVVDLLPKPALPHAAPSSSALFVFSGDTQTPVVPGSRSGFVT